MPTSCRGCASWDWPGKVHLGSDFPNIPYPYADQLDALARLGLGEEWLRAVCWTNTAALLDHTSRESWGVPLDEG